eukprot:scaffold539259_cov21-Prasinocladus_malaysianus.AAC.1
MALDAQAKLLLSRCLVALIELTAFFALSLAHRKFVANVQLLETPWLIHHKCSACQFKFYLDSVQFSSINVLKHNFKANAIQIMSKERKKKESKETQGQSERRNKQRRNKIQEEKKKHSKR